MAITYYDLEPRAPQNIALSFSGGGFRAATYGLGCLSYLDKVMLGPDKLTDKVRFVSSASGGTFTALAWVRSQRKGQNFATFYHEYFSTILKGEILIKRAFQILQDPKAWKERPDKSRNLINAFALTYDELFFQGDTFDIYYQQSGKGVETICANTTEFNNGEQFRFQNTAVAGNKFLHFKDDTSSVQVLRSLKIGDILACSSCFTGGFEPVVFPRDFTYGSLTKQKLMDAIHENPQFNPLKKDDSKKMPFDLMDGGIDDNQGIYSFMLAEERLQTKNKFGYDLYLACDVSSNYTSGYEFPTVKKASLFSRFNTLQYAGLMILFFAASISCMLLHPQSWIGYLFIGITGTLVLFPLVIHLYLLHELKKGAAAKNTFAQIGHQFLNVFLKLPYHILKPMLTSRATSTGYLAMTVYLKKIRRISYDFLFDKISEHRDQPNSIHLKHWSKFVLMNAVYQLSEKNKAQRNKDLENEPWFNNPPILNNGSITQTLTQWMEPSLILQKAASLATEMKTTLWFDKNQENENMPLALLASGQFTSCYNLLRYAFRFPQKDDYWNAVQQQLFGDWCRFQTDPYGFVISTMAD